MKNFMYCILVLCIMAPSIGCAGMNNAQKGAGIGGIGAAVGSMIGRGDSTQNALYGAGGAVLGYIIGNEMDKNQETQSMSYPRTNCHKVTTRRTVNGKTVEIIEEVCNGNKTVNTY